MLSPIMRFGFKTVTGLNIALYRLSRGKFANRIANLPILLLTTTGRKSGKSRTTPLTYIQDGADYVITASFGGNDWNPGWYHNLENNPQATIEVGDKTIPVKVIITQNAERTRLYEQFKAASNNYVLYEQKTSRVIPVMRLKPV
jgi:F420H(2)-dependent quinone reductase